MKATTKRSLIELVEGTFTIQMGVGIASKSWLWVAISGLVTVVFGVWADSVREAIHRARIDRVLSGAHEYGYLDSWTLHALDDRLKYHPEKPFSLNMRGPRSVKS